MSKKVSVVEGILVSTNKRFTRLCMYITEKMHIITAQTKVF